MERFHLITNGPIIDYGGASAMMSVIEKFFPSVLRKMMIMHGPQNSVNCIYDSRHLTALAFSLYIAGLFACLVGSKLSMRFGQQAILLGSIFFFLGGFLNAAAVNCWKK